MYNKKEGETHWLARFFIKQREIIESAETPFAKLAVFVLPIMSPLVPAFMSGLHLYKLFLELFTFSRANEVSIFMASIISLVLELLGYVGAVSFIKSLFDWIKNKKDEYIVPFALNGVAYLFYLLAMFLINVQLGKYFETSSIINNIVALLSFITVPTSLLAANHLNQVENSEFEEKRYQEKREDKIKKKLIDKGINPLTLYNVDSPGIAPTHSSQQQSQSTDWRVVVKTLDSKQIQFIANCNDWKVISKMYYLSERSARNWITNAQKKLSQ